MSTRYGEDAPAGLVVVDKSAGMTSHDVVARVRRLAEIAVDRTRDVARRYLAQFFEEMSSPDGIERRLVRECS